MCTARLKAASRLGPGAARSWAALSRTAGFGGLTAQALRFFKAWSHGLSYGFLVSISELKSGFVMKYQK